MYKHISVLLSESIEKLDLKKSGIYIDATLGRAGHSLEILKNIEIGKLYCFDKDLKAIQESKTKLNKISQHYELIHSDFSNIDKIKEFTDHEIDGILFDLGVSSPQLDEPKRGFSYHNDGPLDMRMNQENDLTAEKVVNEYELERLITIFREYGEDKFAVKVAKEIIARRQEKRIKTTLELVKIIKDAKPHSSKVKKHPAKQIFQAIRIEVNGELNSLKIALEKSLDLIKIGGKVVVITFHSLEDKVVKDVFYNAKLQKEETIFETKHKFRTTKTVYPTKYELDKNRRSKSARLRTIIRNY